MQKGTAWSLFLAKLRRLPAEMPATSDDYPFKNLGKHQRPITTSSPDAQLWFNRGFAWYLGFNFAEAIFCFRQALEIDPNCLFAYWGIAACTGIHYNDPECSDPELARDMLNKAKHLIDGSAPDTFMPVEVALINALRVRHFQPAGTTIEERDKAYSAAMEEVYQQFGKDDADIIAIYVDSLMQLTPWRLWRNGTMADDTRIADILRLLEDGLAIAPNHPGLLHFHIHAWEMSPTPEKAKGTADRLRYASRTI